METQGQRPGSLNGSEVRRRRIAIGWSRDQLAAYVGVPVKEVADWESGDSEIEFTVAVRFALEDGEAHAVHSANGNGGPRPAAPQETRIGNR